MESFIQRNAVLDRGKCELRGKFRKAWILCLVLSTAPLGGCFAFSYRDRDIDRTPEFNTGTGATILYPGQGAPAMPPSIYGQPEAAGSPGSPGGRDTPPEGASGGGSISMLGGTHVDEKSTKRVRESPVYAKYMLLPFAIIAAPFVWIWDAVQPEAEGGPQPPPHAAPVPNVATAAQPPAPDYETQAMHELERELSQRGTPQAAGPAPRSRLSFAEELAELQRAPSGPAPRRELQPTPAPTLHSPSRNNPAEHADGIIDRDGDGRVDHWIFRENGEIVREALDENFDGEVDRTLHFEPGTRRVRLVTEDANHDGSLDTWTEYENGALRRRRGDADGDGFIDSVSFYRDGSVVRIERDTTGDGSRDKIGFYKEGRLVRREEDRDGDGRSDLTTHYDSREQVRRSEEDTDGDGLHDVVSHYENGRLKRRELLARPSHDEER